MNFLEIREEKIEEAEFQTTESSPVPGGQVTETNEWSCQDATNWDILPQSFIVCGTLLSSKDRACFTLDHVPFTVREGPCILIGTSAKSPTGKKVKLE